MKTKKKKAPKKVTFVAGTPKAIRELVAKFNGNKAEASRALGMASNFINAKNQADASAYSSETLARVQLVLDGKPLPPLPTAADNPENQFKLGICIVVAKASQFERLYDIGEAMGGVWLFKMGSGANWIGVMRLAGDKLKTYVKVAHFDALRIAAP